MILVAGAAVGATTVVLELDRVLEDITRITRLSEPVLRNLLITLRYHDLTRSLARVIGPADANWATFATWASKTAGESIRGEVVPRELSAMLAAEAELERSFEELKRAFAWVPFLKLDLDLFDVARAILDEVSRQIAAGNLKVFQELAPLFARFADMFSDPVRRTRDNLDEFLATLRPGEPEQDGQNLLRLAFTAYFEAADALTPKRRAELTLHGNLLIGLHEQTRLQSHIAAALRAPLSDRVYGELRSGLAVLVRPLFRWLFKYPLKSFYAKLQVSWERIATRFLMRLSLPNGASVPLGRDLPTRPKLFPPHLESLEDTVLLALLQRFDASLDTTLGSGALNWSDLGERMGFICELFRCEQQNATLFDPPFDEAQRAALESGMVPPGRL